MVNCWCCYSLGILAFADSCRLKVEFCTTPWISLNGFPNSEKNTVTSWSAVHFVLANPKLSDFYIASWPPAMDTHQWSTPHSPPLGAGKCPPTGVTYNPICACCGYRCRDYINERIRRWRMRRRLNNHGGQRGAHWEINNGQYGSIWQYGPRFACKSRDRQRYEIGDDRRIFTTARFHQ